MDSISETIAHLSIERRAQILRRGNGWMEGEKELFEQGEYVKLCGIEEEVEVE